MMMMVVVVRIFWIFCVIPCLAEYRDQHCCSHSYGKFESSCPSASSCVILIGSKEPFQITHPEGCRVVRDECFDESSLDSNTQDSSFLSFHLRPYVFIQSTHPKRILSGVDLSIPWNTSWKTIRFRIWNEDTFESLNEDPQCLRPRWNTIYRDLNFANDSSNDANEATFSYDCYTTHKSETDAVKDDDILRLDICFDHVHCVTYFFKILLDLKRLILIERKPLLEKRKIVLSTEVSKIRIWAPLINNGTFIENVDPFEPYFSRLNPGVYQVHVLTDGEWKNILDFRVPKIDQRLRLILLFIILFTVIILVTSIYCIKRYRFIKRDGKVKLNHLVQTGQLEALNLLIITNVDHPFHEDIVICFANYLKAHCGVKNIYFAFDSSSEISTQSEHDPRRWSEEVLQKVQSQNVRIIFVCPPSVYIGVPLYLTKTFMTISYLNKMVSENRISLIKFPYSDISTISSLLPQGFLTSIRCYSIPNEMKEFLRQLFQVSNNKRNYFWLSFHPEIDGYDLSQYDEGLELLHKIREFIELNSSQESNVFREGSPITTIPEEEEDEGAESLESNLFLPKLSGRTVHYSDSESTMLRAPLQTEIKPRIEKNEEKESDQ